MKKRLSPWVAIALGIAPVLHAGVIVDTSLNLTGLSIDPAYGMAQILPGVSVAVNATAADNLGESDSESNFATDGPASTSATVSLATGSASGDGSLLTTGSSSTVSIPSLNAAVLPQSTDGNSQLEGFFQIYDPTDPTDMNPVSVNFTAVLSGDQYLMTDPSGISADSEVTFQLLLPDIDSSPFLFYDNPLSIGSNTTLDSPVAQTLTGTATLATNTQYFFFLETDAESDGYDSAPTPEPSSLLLIAAGLAGLGIRRYYNH